jgi:hypothetical protein
MSSHLTTQSASEIALERSKRGISPSIGLHKPTCKSNEQFEVFSPPALDPGKISPLTGTVYKTEKNAVSHPLIAAVDTQNEYHLDLPRKDKPRVKSRTHSISPPGMSENDQNRSDSSQQSLSSPKSSRPFLEAVELTPPLPPKLSASSSLRIKSPLDQLRQEINPQLSCIDPFIMFSHQEIPFRPSGQSTPQNGSRITCYGGFQALGFLSMFVDDRGSHPQGEYNQVRQVNY